MVELSEKQIALLKKNFPKEVELRIRHLRESKKITQTELAKTTGKDRQYIYKIEKGKVTLNISKLKILLTTLEASFEEFFKDFHS